MSIKKTGSTAKSKKAVQARTPRKANTYKRKRKPETSRIYGASMSQYAIAFDLDTKAMNDDGLTDSDRVMIYQQEIPNALAECGFTVHAQGSLYHTDSSSDPISNLMMLRGILKTQAKHFCKYLKVAHVFRLEEWSDVTDILATNPRASATIGTITNTASSKCSRVALKTSKQKRTIKQRIGI